MLEFLTLKKSKSNLPILLFDEIKTIVGTGDFFKGELVSNNFIRLDGDFLGVINSSKRVIVGETARIKSNICANEIVVSGIILGNIYAKNKIKIFASGCVIGNISCKSIEVEEGAIIDGYMNIGLEHLKFSKKDTFVYAGSYKVDENVLVEVNKGIQETRVYFQKSLKDENNKYLLNAMTKIDENK